MVVSVSAHNVRKSYGKEDVLKGLSLDLHEGEILALLGPNGSGKTTLIKILATLLTKDSGSVRVLGYDIDKDADAIRHLFGYVGQDTERSAYARLSVTENLRFFGALRGMSRQQIDAQIEKLAHYFEFNDNLGKLFGYLSGGQKQTVVIMRALLHDPPLIYLDEPTKGLDPIIAKKMRAFLIKFIGGEQKTMLLTSHILSEVDELADRVALIYNGAIASVGSAAELKQSVGVEGFIEMQRDAISPAIRDSILALPAVVSHNEQGAEWVAFGITDMIDATEGIVRILRTANAQTQFRYRSVSLEDAFVRRIGILSDTFEA